MKRNFEFVRQKFAKTSFSKTDLWINFLKHKENKIINLRTVMN